MAKAIAAETAETFSGDLVKRVQVFEIERQTGVSISKSRLSVVMRKKGGSGGGGPGTV
jgi:hypothetical protein